MHKYIYFFGAGLLSLFLSFAATAQTAAVTPYELKKQEANQIAVSIVTSGLSCTCARFAQDMSNVINDIRPDGIRVLPILGVGGAQNLEDVLFLRGVDMATVDQDHIEYLKKKDPTLYANLESRVSYITKLYNSEFHIAARNEIKRLSDLQGKRVSFNLENSHTNIAADIIFDMIGVKTQKVFYDNNEAIELLKTGKLDAHVVLTGAPQSALAKLKATDGIHFLPLTETDLPTSRQDALLKRYLPADLTHEQYPDLIAQGETVPTIATRTVLAVYNWEPGSYRYRKLEKFVQAFFSKIGEFRDKARHPKWVEVNLATDVPGWTRFKPAQDWLDGNRNAQQVATAGEDSDLRASFEKFLATYRQSSGQTQITPKDREKLFAQFKQFLAFQSTQLESR
jgi:uncharacterized protein